MESQSRVSLQIGRRMVPRFRTASLIALCLTSVHPQLAQTTQGIITGRVFDRQTKAAIADVTITYSRLDTNQAGRVRTDARGFYAIPFLSPGRYRIGAEAPNYQAQDLRELYLAVAARIELNFPLRSFAELKKRGIYGGVSMPGRREVINFFGPDVGFAAPLQVLSPQSGTLQPSLSYVIESQEINALPLRGRDVYSLLLTVPGATSDNATARSLGLSINGQRPSSSNFLLDGIENNDFLNTGTQIQIAPEVAESYRISTNNFSAEFGRTSGFVANVVTRSGSNAFHGIGYAYIGNDALNANSFQDNLSGLTKRPDRQIYTGFWLGGPVKKNRFYFSSGFERYQRRANREPVQYRVLGSGLAALLLPGSISDQLFTHYPPPGPTRTNAVVQSVPLAAPLVVDQYLLLERLDYNSKSGANRLTGRFAASRQSQPDFVFSPYKEFISGSRVNNSGVAIEYLHSLSASLVNDLRGGFQQGEQRVDRSHPELPTLQISDGTNLPGSPILSGFRDTRDTMEITDSVASIRGRHVITAGGGFELIRPSSTATFGQAGPLVFSSVLDYALDRPSLLELAVSRKSLPSFVPPDYTRHYTNKEFFGFLQDNFRLATRLGVSAGIRYDSFGTLKNIGTQDAFLRLGPGSSIADRLAASTIEFDNKAQNSVYQPDRNGWSGRLGFSYDLRGNGRTVLRGAFGIFYDRPFELLTQNIRYNNVDFRFFPLPNQRQDYLRPPNQIVRGQDPGFSSFSTGFPDFYWIDQGLRTPHVQSWFVGVQRQVSTDLTVEINQMGALGRKLIATDIVNRVFSVTSTAENPSGRYNANLPETVYRSNSGSSNYLALGALVKYRGRREHIQVSYTYSHSIDNQSDPLLGEFLGLMAQSSTRGGTAAFTRQFDSRVDRGNSDFDQRHNLVFYSIFEIPDPVPHGWLKHVLGGWETSQLGAFRSGFPFSIIASGGVNSFIDNRPDLAGNDDPFMRHSPSIAGGRQLLNPASFTAPANNLIGNVGRNSTAGPGFWTVDASIAKSFHLPILGDSGRVQLRGDFFNIFNHTNLANPDPDALILGSPTFGAAQFGRTGRPSSSLLVSPLDETPRQIQLQLKVTF